MARTVWAPYKSTIQIHLCPGWFLCQVDISWSYLKKEGISTEKILHKIWLRHFLTWWLMGRTKSIVGAAIPGLLVLDSLRKQVNNPVSSTPPWFLYQLCLEVSAMLVFLFWLPSYHRPLRQIPYFLSIETELLRLKIVAPESCNRVQICRCWIWIQGPWP